MARVCAACEDGDHAECGMQTWCECECDPAEAAIDQALDQADEEPVTWPEDIDD